VYDKMKVASASWS